MSQRSFWSASETAERGPQDVGRRRLDFAEATQRMLEAAGLGPGDHALDIAAGTGDQSILAARMVEPGGSILATDISEEMLVAHVRAVAWSLLSSIPRDNYQGFPGCEQESSGCILPQEPAWSKGRSTDRDRKREWCAMNTINERSADVQALHDLFQQMQAGWNRGDGQAYAAPFTEDADFISVKCQMHLHFNRPLIRLSQHSIAMMS